jgi:transposase-like protein
MKKEQNDEMRSCPVCEKTEGQMKNGRNRSGTQTYICRFCKKVYTPEPKHRAYDEETRKMAIKMYYFGVSGRGVGKVLGMNKGNVYNWIKKNG